MQQGLVAVEVQEVVQELDRQQGLVQQGLVAVEVQEVVQQLYRQQGLVGW